MRVVKADLREALEIVTDAKADGLLTPEECAHVCGLLGRALGTVKAGEGEDTED